MGDNAATKTTLEWFGATTFRLRTRGLTIFLDTYLDRPSILPKYLAVDDVTECDYIFISHAHFDHLPGADRIAKRTGAIVIANCEAINLLKEAGVPEEQLFPVYGGERIGLFLRDVREKARRGECPLQPGPPDAPPLPHGDLAVMSAHIWPSLHCFVPPFAPGTAPEKLDSGVAYAKGLAHPYFCTLDITRGMKYSMLRMGEGKDLSTLDPGRRSFAEFVADRKRNVMSHCDGGQLMVNFVAKEDNSALLWSAHQGCYEGVLRYLEPKPDIAILGIAGRGNLNGIAWDGSSAEFVLNEIQWLQEPKTVIWCLHDAGPMKPYGTDTKAVDDMLEQRTKSRVLHLDFAGETELAF